MLRDVAVARIQRGLGYRTDQSDNIVLALQEAQRLLERGRTLPKFLQSYASISVVAGTGVYPLPTRFLREDEEYPMVYYTGTPAEPVYLKKAINYPDVETQPGALQLGDPEWYFLDRGVIYIYPQPASAVTISFGYYRGGELLTTNIENVWLKEAVAGTSFAEGSGAGAPEVLIYRAGAIIAEDLGNTEAFAKFGRLFQEAWNGMLGDLFQRDEANYPTHMGSRL